MNTNQQNQINNNKRTTTNTNAVTYALLVMILVMFVICGGCIYKCENLNKQLKTSKKAAFSWAVKYAEEKDKSDTLITAVCQQQFKDFIPKTNYDWIHHDNCRKFIKQTLQECNINIPAGFLDNQKTK